jgi:hypothetical protein
VAAGDIIERLREQRSRWFETAEGRRVKIRRPSETECITLVGGLGVEHAQRYVVGWDGYTEADLLGAAVGSGDAVPFDAELWAEYVADHAELATQVVGWLGDMIVEHLKAKREAQGN